MGTAVSNSVRMAKFLLPDRDTLVDLGLLPEKTVDKSKVNRFQRQILRQMKPMLVQMKISLVDTETFQDLYMDCDLNGNQVVTYINFCEYFHLIPGHFIEAMFFNFNKEQPMSFQHFLVVLYYFCAPGPKCLAKHIFAVYDRRRTGKIHEMIVEQIVREIYTKGFRFDPGATNAIFKLINCEKEYKMVDEEQFVEIMWKSLSPALDLQSDIRKRCMDFVFWWKVAKKGVPTSKITYYEAWDFQSEVTTKAKEDEAMAARIEAYKSRGGTWKDDAPPPKAETEKDRFDAHGNLIVIPPPAPKENKENNANMANNLVNVKMPRQKIHPKGRTLILPAIKRKKAKEVKVKEVKVVPLEDLKSPKKEAPQSETMVVVRPETLKIYEQRIPVAMGYSQLGQNGFESSMNTVVNFEKLAQGRDLGDLISAMGSKQIGGRRDPK